MSKDTKFSIHDWQSKQRLNELRATDIPGTAAWMGARGGGLSVGGGEADTTYTDKDKIYDAVLHEVKQAFATYMSPDFPPFSQEYLNDPKYVVKLAERISEKAAKDIGLKEMNTTGGGASFNAGDGMGYATPNAFKKKRKED